VKCDGHKNTEKLVHVVILIFSFGTAIRNIKLLLHDRYQNPFSGVFVCIVNACDSLCVVVVVFKAQFSLPELTARVDG